MRDKTIVTITTVSGSKSYTVDQVLKKTIYYILGFLGLLFIGGGVSIYFLYQEMDAYKELREKYYRLMVANSDLELEIKDKKLALDDITDKIADIEEMIGMKPKEGLETDQRLNTAKINAAERLLMLRTIPSGHPVEYQGVTSRFGWRSNPIQPGKQEFHTGIDLRAQMNTPVYATADGIVEVARTNKQIGYGKLLILDHNFGIKTLYAHLNKIIVKPGTFIKKGQVVAYSGNTGYSNGPHLHYEIRYIGIALDPSEFMRWDLQNYEEIFEKERKVRWESLVKGIKWQWTLLEQLSSQKEQKLPEN